MARTNDRRDPNFYKGKDGEEGVWRTIGGRRVFIKNGQNLADAMKESGKFKTTKSGNVQREDLVKAKAELDKRFIHEQERDLEKAYDTNRYKLGTDYWGDKLNQAKEMENNEKRFIDNYDKPSDYYASDLDETIGKHVSKEQLNEAKKLKTLEESIKRDKELGNTANRMKAIDDAERYDRIHDKYIDQGYSEEEFKKVHGERPKTGLEDIGKEKGIETKKENKPQTLEEIQENIKKNTPKEIQEKYEQRDKDFDEKEYDKRFKGGADYRYAQEKRNPYDDPESEESQRLQSIQSRYDDYLQKTEGRGASYGEIAYVDGLRGKDLDDFEKELDDFEAKEEKKSTNKKMNDGIRAKASKKSTFKDDLPKASEIKEQGNSNRKEVSENIQAHILDFYENPQDFVEQMENMSEPTMWHAGQRLAEGGSYDIYTGDMRDFLNSLKINPKGKEFDDDRVFQTYTSLIGRESERLYNRLKKNAYNKYKQEHPLTKMSFEEFKDMNKR